MKNQVSWNGTSWRLLNLAPFRGKGGPLTSGSKVQEGCLIQNIEAMNLLEMSVNIYQSTKVTSQKILIFLNTGVETSNPKLIFLTAFYRTYVICSRSPDRRFKLAICYLSFEYQESAGYLSWLILITEAE